MVCVGVDVIDIQGSRTPELPCATNSCVERVRLHKVIRNYGAELKRSASGKDGRNIGIETQPRLILDDHRRCCQLVHRSKLKPWSVAGDVHAPSTPQHNPPISAHIVGRAKARLQIIGVSASIVADELTQSRKRRITPHVLIEVVDTQRGIKVVSKAEVEPQTRRRAPTVLYEQRELACPVGLYVRWLLLERCRPRCLGVRVEWKVAAEHEKTVFEEMGV